MDRREALRNTALMLGYAVSASTVVAVMQGCTSDSVVDDSDGWKPEFLTADEVRLVKSISETILPKTDTPGAVEAGVHKYIDVMVAQNRNTTEQMAFRTGLSEFDKDFKSTGSKSFARASSEEQHAYLVRLDEETRKAMNDENRDRGERRLFYAQIKELVFVGYFTSELIGENYLNYDPVPGVYHGCISLEETGGKAWSL